MRKILLALVFVLLTTASAWSAQELNLYIWSEYMGPEIVPNFEKQTGIKVRVDYYETMEDMMAKLQAGGASQYDLVVPTDYGIPAMIKLGLLKELDHSKIPNMKNLNAKFIDVPTIPKTPTPWPINGAPWACSTTRKRSPNPSPGRPCSTRTSTSGPSCCWTPCARCWASPSATSA
jgi:spermidine/putrescine-binding protein